MLPLEKQVTSLETSRKLKELGVKQESLFYWWKQCSAVHQGHSKDSVNYIYLIQPYFDGLNIDEDFHYSAFTSSELGELLPKEIDTHPIITLFILDEWVCKYQKEHWAPIERFTDKTECEVRAKMLIHLLENKLITLEKTNE